MRQFMMTVMALAVFGAMVATVHAENQTPNPPTDSGSVKKRAVSQTARPSQQAVSAAATCTGLKSACLSVTSRKGCCTYLGGNTERGFGRGPYCEKQCNFTWEQSMKSGF
jgi:hypothetical protein